MYKSLYRYIHVCICVCLYIERYTVRCLHLHMSPCVCVCVCTRAFVCMLMYVTLCRPQHATAFSQVYMWLNGPVIAPTTPSMHSRDKDSLAADQFQARQPMATKSNTPLLQRLGKNLHHKVYPKNETTECIEWQIALSPHDRRFQRQICTY